MAVNTNDVKALREKTGAGLMDCKKALEQAEGDLAKAEKILKEMGLFIAEKKSGRATNEGRIFSYVSARRGALLELSCETDFVARNNSFVATGNKMAKHVADKNLTAADAELEGMMKDCIGIIKENMLIKRMKTIDAGPNEFLADYVHNNGRMVVVIKMASNKPECFQDKTIQKLAADCAVHIVGCNPMFLSEDKVDPAYLKEQEGIFAKQAENLGKPANVLAGIVKGKTKKLYEEICLLNQPFVMDEKRSVSQVLKDAGKASGCELSIVDYLSFELGK